jgi:hypothetical protein
MGLVTRTYTYTAGNTINPTENNANENTLFTLVNGNIDNDNIKTAAGIVSTKIAIVDPSYPHTSTYDTLDDHISDSVAHGGGLSQFERFRYNVLSTGTSVVPRWYNKSGQTKTITAVFGYVATAPTGANLIVDVNYDGTTIFTTQSNRLTIAATETSGTSGTPEVVTVEDGHYIDFDIDQVGSTVPGSDLLLVVYF